ncbi:hypothetical protein NQ317_002430 [Molorchus minor]|uniref:VWFA domain-containing protein n=1 Tax=Molorchus minor TaxID=1323400 RepID=A0ABQ9IZL3_9CUCU|nr:hypothetical protein NQ317_002430 [Molorchus minor]
MAHVYARPHHMLQTKKRFWILLRMILQRVLEKLHVSSISFGQEENRDTKQHPELTQLVRTWAEKLGGELWHFGELVTRKTKVKDSFKDTTIVVEDGDVLLRNIHENISNMMKKESRSSKGKGNMENHDKFIHFRIMDIAEQAAKDQKEEDIDFNFQFFNGKNLTNSLENSSAPEDGSKVFETEPQELSDDDSFISPNRRLGGRYEAMVQPEEIDGYQQDQDLESPEETSPKDEVSLETDEISLGTEKVPQASQTQPKDRSKLPLYRNRHFYNIPVNTNYSAVHVPSNVYDRSKEVISGIIWSEELDKTFKNNYKLDPTLSWQYFGSSTGFMRQFPAMIWSQEPIDLFDCRTRSWYIEAASSPKDIVILVDRSGSMTGMRREIARHVVYNILDTLGNNDYVNIFTFSNTTDPLVECFDKKLVQANLANVRVLKDHMGNFKTEQIANFSLALITAFELLQDFRISEKRVFTYLIGREVSDVREVKWMACANQGEIYQPVLFGVPQGTAHGPLIASMYYLSGYYVHLSTYAEVREEVLQYIPVMARPMVLNATHKPNPTWSPVYADVTDPKLTNWLWINRERNKQRERLLEYIKLKYMLSADTIDRKFVHQQKTKQDNYGDIQTYHLMTSVSLPVYDKKPRQERVANLLGVAGTDVPIEYIQRLMMSYRLGVNGYAFIVTNNGYILTHPDLRPVYQGILKPAYNRVDMIEIEVLDDDTEPREFSDEVREFRRRVIFQEKGNVTFKIKGHLDDMRRIITMTRHYFFMGINGTPFSLVIALPHKYGFNRVQHQVENDIHRIRLNDKVNNALTQYFTGNWTIHPDWHYCRYLDDREYFETPEDEFLYFLKKMEGPGWKWSKECDRKLICKVVADAKITAWFNQNITTSTKEENGAQLVRNIGIVVAFLATHSGLTRWQNFPQNIDALEHEPNIRILHNKAIDEIWYRRAVEQHYVDPSNFVYSVPHEIGNVSNFLVTVSHAIFREEAGKKAPVAVVGYQFYHSALNALFIKITNSVSKQRFASIPTVFSLGFFQCGDRSCTRTCGSEEIHCLMLDDNGFVIISDQLQDTGYFFGKIRSDIMTQLVEEGIYKVTRVYDYQGLCPSYQETASPASRFISPLASLMKLLDWLYHAITWSTFFTSPADALDEIYRLFHEHLQEKQKNEPCDHEIFVYSLNVENSALRKSHVSTHLVRNERVNFSSNLLLLVFNDTLLYPMNDTYRLGFPEYTRIDYGAAWECAVDRQNFSKRSYGDCFSREEANWAVSTVIYLANIASGYQFEAFSDSIMYPDQNLNDHLFEDQDQMIQDHDSAEVPYAEKDLIRKYIIPKTKPGPCDNELWLYSLVHYTERNISNSGYNKTMEGCSRPFIVQRVTGSNMILLVINNLCKVEESLIAPDPEPRQLDYNMSLYCYRAINNDFPRRLKVIFLDIKRVIDGGA